MTSSRLPLDLLADMLTEAEYARSFVVGFTFDTFVADPRTVRAVAHSVQTVGEAVYQLDAAVKAREPVFPWGLIEKMRHILVHHYWKTNLDILWATVARDLPVLIETVTRLRTALIAEQPPEAPA